jgi:hypothetical protein
MIIWIHLEMNVLIYQEHAKFVLCLNENRQKPSQCLIYQYQLN